MSTFWLIRLSEMKMQSCFATILNHIKNDVKYPANKNDIIHACSDFSEISKNERDWLDSTLPDRSYIDPEEVVKAIFDKI